MTKNVELWINYIHVIVNVFFIVNSLLKKCPKYVYKRSVNQVGAIIFHDNFQITP